MFGHNLTGRKMYGSDTVHTTRMLSVKYRKIHGMQDSRWTIRDRLNQYRGILKLHERDKKKRTREVAQLKKNISHDLKTLKNDIKQYREIAKETIEGDRRRLQNVLQGHKDLRLAYRQAKQEDVYQPIHQDNNLKRRQLDKLYYQKKKMARQLFSLKLEQVKLADRYDRENGFKEMRKTHQQLITRCHDSLAKYNAARNIYMAYLSMISILQKDKVYFDAAFDALKHDQSCQCKVILKTIWMGQLAAENLDDIRETYKRMAKDVWVNMKEREGTLQVVQKQVEDLQTYARSLVRVESNTELIIKNQEGSRSSDRNLENQIEQVEKIFNKMKNSLLVRSYYDLRYRIEEQARQRQRLLAQFNYNLKKRDEFLNKKNHALLILTDLEYTSTSITGNSKIEMKTMLEHIEDEKKRESELKNLRKSRGTLLLRIKSSLQNFTDVLVCVQANEEKKPGKKGQLETAAKIEEKTHNDHKSQRKECQLDKIENDALAMLATVSRKATTLFTMGNFELDEDKEVKARDMYQTYVSDFHSNLKFGIEETGVPVFYGEHDTTDATVPTRRDIKLQSKKTLEAHAKIH